MPTSRQLLCGLMLTLCASPLRADFQLGNDDCVLYYGDTLVDRQGFVHFVESFVRARYPELNTRFVNPGFRQRTVGEGLRRLGDVLTSVSPTVVVVLFGFHDPARQPFEADKLEEFRKDYLTLVQVVQATGARVVLVTPPQPAVRSLAKFPGVDYAEIIGHYATTIREIGVSREVAVVDWYARTGGQDADHKVRDVAHQRRSTLPSKLEHAMLAAQLLKLWQAQPIEVNIEADWNAETGRVSTGSLEVRRRTATELLLKLDDLPLPWGLPRVEADMLEAADWPGAALCSFNLRITGVPQQGVELISGSVGDKRSAAELDRGINIAGLDPIQSRNTNLAILNKYIADKYDWQKKYWSEVRPRRPREPELHEAFETYCQALQRFERGTAEIIARLPRTFDVLLTFRELPPAPPAKPPAEDPS